MEESGLTGVFIGGQSLLIQCAELWLSKGHKILGVLSEDPNVRVWSERNEIPHFEHDERYLRAFQGVHFDYLLSINNLSVTPGSILSLADKGAVNFHDGPLPRYAGLNATAWALINRETHHGVTWHLMNYAVDEGDIVKQKQFPIYDTDTAFTLNARCLEAGFECFRELLNEFSAGTVRRVPQNLKERTYVARSKRPSSAGIIDWTVPAAQTEALFRGLDFGHYANPIGLPKVCLGDRIFTVRELRCVPGIAESPGTIVETSDDVIRVSTGDGFVELRALSTVNDTAVPLSTALEQAQLKAGDRLPPLDAEFAERITVLDRALCKHEPFWVRQLASAEPVDLPYTKQPVGEDNGFGNQLLDMDASLPPERPGDLLLAASALFAARVSNQASIWFGYGYEGLSCMLSGCESLFARHVPMRVDIDAQQTFQDFCDAFLETAAGLQAHQTYPRDVLQRYPELRGCRIANGFSLALERVHQLEQSPQENEQPDAPFLQIIIPDDGTQILWRFRNDVYERADIVRMHEQFSELLRDILSNDETSIGRLSVVPHAERVLMAEWNDTQTPTGHHVIHALFEAQVERTPDAPALRDGDHTLSYRQLNVRANRLAHNLMCHGVGPDDLIGIMMDRSAGMVTAMLAILKAGAAYVPLDPQYPPERIRFMVTDSQVRFVITEQKYSHLLQDSDAKAIIGAERADAFHEQPETNPEPRATSGNLAYVIYTSGSTGQPKGVMVEHGNVANFFQGMDAELRADPPGVWLAATSISFDISVLEIFWSLARGFTVVLYNGDDRKPRVQRDLPRNSPGFSLYYFASDDGGQSPADQYKVLMEGAKFADAHGFAAVWTPERHFHAFGGLYPNPSVTSAALAAVTEHVKIRAGSCVLPLHHPVRVAEEWAFVDNISHGRVGISFATGWQPNDFVLAPQNYAQRHDVMAREIETVRALWRGESIRLPGPKGEVDIRIFPRPIQQELPVWVTAAGNPETFRQAGAMGANLLTHLLGQSVAELAEKIRVYRRAWQEHGHAGQGHVTLMLHTFVSEDEAFVRSQVHAPLKRYLRSAAGLIKQYASSFPAFSSAGRAADIDEIFASLSDADLDALMEHAYNRYYESSGLFGTPAGCVVRVDELARAGADEIACLIDFGIPSDIILSQLPHLAELRERIASIGQAERREDESIPALIERHGVTHFQCTPSMASMLVADAEGRVALGKLKQMLVGGEALSRDLAQQLRSILKGELINVYGPTETTIWSTTYRVDEINGFVPIGRPLANTELFILDRNLQPLPIGAPGELYISGQGVARGYWRRPELTAERFIEAPSVPPNRRRVYRTGDVVRYRLDGNVEYLGRADNQVKIRGYRIELGEIESVLRTHESVREAVVIAREDQRGDKSLFAYLVPQQGMRVDAGEIRTFLKQTLAEFMIPSGYVALEALPLTPNGKIDRKALPATNEIAPDIAVHRQAPRNAVEEIVAQHWGETLALRETGVYDNFFELGGHSLSATQLIARLRKTFRVELPLHSIFETPTIAGLAQTLIEQQDTGRIESMAEVLVQMRHADETKDDDRAGISMLLPKQERADGAHVLPPIEKCQTKEPRPLSFGQQRLWFLERLEPGCHYNDSFALRIHGGLDLDKLERSINEIVARHEVLRTSFETSDGTPYQVVAPVLNLKLDRIDLRETPQAARTEELHARMGQQIRLPFDLSTGPVLRAAAYRQDEQEFVFLLVIHQIANDSWSLGRFVDELFTVYQAFLGGDRSPLPALAIQYADYAQWQRRWLEGEVLDRELAYWQNKLSGELPVLDLAADHSRPPIQTFNGARHFVAIPEDLVARLRKFSVQSGCTPFIALLAAFKALLYHYTGQTDIVVGAPIANREHEETAPLIGMFINTLVLRTDLAEDPTFRQIVKRVLQTATEAYDHSNVPFERLVEALHPERDLSRTPLFQILFDYQNTPLDIPQLPGLSIVRQHTDAKMSRFDLTLELTECADGLVGHWEYNTDLFDAARVKRMAAHFHQLLAAALDNPEQPLSTLPLLSPAEMDQLLVDWNATTVSFPLDKSIHQLIEEQAATTPDQIALIMGDESLTYSQLEKKANRLASYLKSKGLRGNVPVGIYMERSLDMVVAMLGILKAGGAYLPLDPSYPEARIAYMLQDSQAPLLVTHGKVRRRVTDFGVATVLIDELPDDFDENSVNPIDPSDLAYIIYTSGSTGKPKGVEVPHRTVVNFLGSMQREPGIQSTDVLLAVTTISFDISVLEIFLPLISGATVVIADQDMTTDGKQLAAALQQHRVSVMQATPATWRLLLAAGWQGSTELKALCGGEAMLKELIDELTPRAGAGLWNMYGPTETTVWSSCYRIKGRDDSPYIGRPIANTRMYILGPNMRPVPAGVPGELYIGGAGVVRGYHRRPELTDERFIPDPFSDDPTARLYETGDLARYAQDGNIEYLQRIDSQVKLRGFRIELGEIEEVLVTHSAVTQSAVAVHEERPGDKRLVAYVVFERGQQATNSELRRYLKAKLPDYMVPAMYVDMDRLPLTPNGKTDRKALPNPFQAGTISDAGVPPRNTIEKRIAAIWSDALHVDRIGIHDNFFELGGHSLLCMRVIARIEKETGCSVGPRAMVMDTLEQIAAVCGTEVDQATSPAAPEQRQPKTLFGKIVANLTKS